MTEDQIDAVSKALRQAWQLGQTYWRQADSESYRENAKSDATQAKFDALVDQTRALLSASIADTAGAKPVVSDDTPIEVWHGERKVTIYPDIVLRVWGPNIDTEMSDAPRTLQSVQDAMAWLFAAAPAPSVADNETFTELMERTGPSSVADAAGARIERLRKGLFEARDAMRVMSNWSKKSDPAGYGWAVRMVDRANAILNHEPEAAAGASEGHTIGGVPVDHSDDVTITREHYEDLLRQVNGASEGQAQPISDFMMDLVDRLGSEADAVDPRAWKHLLVYAPKEGSRQTTVISELKQVTQTPDVSYEHLFALAKMCGLIGPYSIKEVNDRIIGYARVVLNDNAVQEAFVRANEHVLSAEIAALRERIAGIEKDAQRYREVGVWEPDGSKFKTYRNENLNGKAMFVREEPNP